MYPIYTGSAIAQDFARAHRYVPATHPHNGPSKHGNAGAATTRKHRRVWAAAAVFAVMAVGFGGVVEMSAVDGQQHNEAMNHHRP